MTQSIMESLIQICTAIYKSEPLLNQKSSDVKVQYT